MTETEILMINYEYPPIGGGTAKVCQKVVEELNDEKISIHVITSSKSSYSESKDGNLTIERLDVNKKEDHVWRFIEVFIFIMKASYRVRKLTKEKDFDLIHAWTGFPCGVTARLTNEPYIVTLRGGDVPGFDERFSFAYPFITPLIRNIWQNAEAVIPNSTGLKELAKETSNVDMKVIPNGVDTEKFYAKKEYELDSRELKLVTVCRLTEMKRVSDIIKAISAFENVKLDVIGTGSLESDLMELVKEKGLESQVNFLGYVDNDVLPQYLTDADIFVLASLNEGMSNSLLEGLSAGLPVITTDVGGSSELLDDNGFLVEKKDPESIEDAIEKYLDNPKLLEEHGRKSRRIAESKSWRNVSEKFYKTYMKFGIQ